MSTLRELAQSWRERASLLADHGAMEAANTCHKLANELDAALHESADEALTLEQAAAESGYSTDRLRHMVAAGDIPQAGRRGAPRIRRGDLPRKRPSDAGPFDPAAAARRVLRAQP